MERKITVLDSGIFPILKVENFLAENEYEDIKNEIRQICVASSSDGHGLNKSIREDSREYKRIYLDTFYGQDPTKSKILTVVGKNLFDAKMLETYDDIQETAYKTLSHSTAHETQLTIYLDNCSYNWHTDNDSGRIVNYVLIVDMGMKFDGGHTQISNEPADGEKNFLAGLDKDVVLDIKPKGNQLIIMPAWVSHRVTRIIMKSKELLDGRITINGHIGFNR